MRAATFQGVGRKLTVEEVADPTPAADEVILAIAYAGICGSDLHMAKSEYTPHGLIFGHEFSGEIVSLGSRVKKYGAGQRVTALPLTPCRQCDACYKHLPALCPSNLFLGCSLEAQGAYAQYLAVRADMLQPLPQGISYEEGAIVEPLAVGRHVVSLANMPRGASVLILGAGPIGAAAALFSRHAGASHVVVSDPSAGRRAHAKLMGATAVIDPCHQDVRAAYSAATGEDSPRFILECVGIEGMLQQAVTLAAARGKIVAAGVLFTDDRLSPIVALGKELTIQYSQAYQVGDFEAVITALAKREIDAQPMHTATVSLTQLPDMFESLSQPSNQAKVLIRP
ncbi:alcohol dehydrogenase catalytic domain-containing protein [Sphingopyxis sp. FBM22]|nr:alcohol dehydrogenase catalytic domain-containing protein [Sphingopyxis yananensis]